MQFEWTLVNHERGDRAVALGPEEVIAWCALVVGDYDRAYDEVYAYIVWWNNINGLRPGKSAYRDPTTLATNVTANVRRYIAQPERFSVNYDWRQSPPVLYAEARK